MKKNSAFWATTRTDDEGNPVLDAISSGKLKKGYKSVIVTPSVKDINPKYEQDLDEVIKQTGGDPDIVDSSIKNILRDVKKYRKFNANLKSKRVYTNPDGSEVTHREIYGERNPRSMIAEGMLESMEEDSNLDLVKNVSTVIERLDKLNEKEYSGFLNLTKKLASEFSVDNSPAENFKILKNLDTSELKKYREKMGLSKQDLLNLIVPPDGTPPWLNKLMKVGKKTIGLFKEF